VLLNEEWAYVLVAVNSKSSKE